MNYHNILSKKSYITSAELNQQLQLIFKKLVTNIRAIAMTNEYPASNTPMTLIFPFLRAEIMRALLAVSPPLLQSIASIDYLNFKW